jgi:hypothetical protein
LIVKITPITATARPEVKRIKEKRGKDSGGMDYRFWRFTVLFPEVTWALTDDFWGTVRRMSRVTGTSWVS